MDFLHDFALGVLMLFVAFMVFDWSRIWWYARRHGIIKYNGRGDLDHSAHPYRWSSEYLLYRIWTWVIRVAAWLICLWHLALAVCWFIELAFTLSVP